MCIFIMLQTLALEFCSESMTQKLTHAYIIVMAEHAYCCVCHKHVYCVVFSTGTYLLFKKCSLFVLLNLIQLGIYKRFKYLYK